MSKIKEIAKSSFASASRKISRDSITLPMVSVIGGDFMEFLQSRKRKSNREALELLGIVGRLE